VDVGPMPSRRFGEGAADARRLRPGL